MALTRKFLKGLEIDEDKIDLIISAHSDTVNAIKDERDSYKDNAEKYETVKKELDKANQKLKGYTDKGEMISKEEYDKVKADLDNLQADIKAKETKTAKETAVKNLLKEFNVADNRIPAILRLYDLDSVELDKDGNIVDSDKQRETIKTDWADYIGTVSTKGANDYTPNNNTGGTASREKILAIKDGTTRRQEMAKHPELFGITTTTTTNN